jgi:hypothetical protein
MNNDHTDPWESEMSREFDRRVRDLHEAPLTFENVKGKAMTIRRNRRIAVAGGILAAAAVVVPVAVLAGNNLGDSNGTIDPAETPTVTQATDPNDPTPTETPAGALGVSYLEGSTWHRADGSSVKLDERYFSGVELGDQLLASSNDGGAWTVDVVEPDGSITESFDVLSLPPVANDENTAVAYVATDGTLMTRWADGEVAMGDGLVDGDSVAALAGGPDCNEEGDGCVVYVEHGDGSAPEQYDSHGIVDQPVPGAYAFNDASVDGRIAVQTSFSDAGSCSAVHEVGGTEAFETCDYSFDDFSPDGTFLSGTDAYRDGIGQSYVVILDATDGEEIARWEATEGFAVTWVWEDAEHLLINAYEQGEWRIYRLGADGSSEQVLSSSKGGEMSPAFTLLGGS